MEKINELNPKTRPDENDSPEFLAIDPKKKTISLIFAGIGLIFVLIALSWFLFEWLIPGFGFISENSNGSYFVNFSFLIGLIFLFIGLYLISKIEMSRNSLKQNYFSCKSIQNFREPLLDSIKYTSIPKSRFLTSSLFLILGIWTYLEFGAEMGRLAYKGQWFTLGGPSVFFIMGIIPSLIAVCLIIYCIGAFAQIELHRTEHFYVMVERRLFSYQLTEIPHTTLEGIHINNTHLGPKLCWIFPLSFLGLYLVGEGLYLLTNPLTFGYGLEVGAMFIVSGVFNLSGLFILIFWRQDFLEFETNDRLYELLSFIPKAKRNNVLKFFRIIPLNERKSQNNVNSQNKIDLSGLIHNYRLWIGILFEIIAIIGWALRIGAGEYLRWTLFMYGKILIIKALSQDILITNSEESPAIENEQELSSSFYSQKRRYYSLYIQNLNTIPEAKRSQNYNPILQKWDVFDLLFIGLIFFTGCWQIPKLFLYLPTTFSNYSQFIGINLALVFVVLILGFILGIMWFKKGQKEQKSAQGILIWLFIAIPIVLGLLLGFLL